MEKKESLNLKKISLMMEEIFKDKNIDLRDAKGNFLRSLLGMIAPDVPASFVGKSLRILDFFIENKDTDFCKGELAEGAKISNKLASSTCKGLAKKGVLKETRKYGNAQLYTLNQENEEVKNLLETLAKFRVQKIADPTDRNFPVL